MLYMENECDVTCQSDLNKKVKLNLKNKKEIEEMSHTINYFFESRLQV